MNYANIGQQEAILEFVNAIENGPEIDEIKRYYNVTSITDINGLDKDIKAEKRNINGAFAVEDPGPLMLEKTTMTLRKQTRDFEIQTDKVPEPSPKIVYKEVEKIIKVP